MTAVEQLKQEAGLLSEPLAQEVLDFLLFVREKHGTGGHRDFSSALPERGKVNHSNALQGESDR